MCGSASYYVCVVSTLFKCSHVRLENTPYPKMVFCSSGSYVKANPHQNSANQVFQIREPNLAKAPPRELNLANAPPLGKT